MLFELRYFAKITLFEYNHPSYLQNFVNNQLFLRDNQHNARWFLTLPPTVNQLVDIVISVIAIVGNTSGRHFGITLCAKYQLHDAAQ